MRLAVVIVTFNSADQVGAVLLAVEEQLEDADELVVVDNASTDATVGLARDAGTRARVLEPRSNLGFAAGCHAGAAATSAPLILFLNPDAMPAPGCIGSLRWAAAEREGWGAWQALVTMDSETKINTAGNITHFLGMGWAGGCGRPLADAPEEPTEVSFASGAALVVRRSDWDELGGFDPRYFMYGEDLDLSLRLWLSGRQVGVVPAARVEHAYEFAKGSEKWYLLERNRWWTVLGDYPGALLLAVLPALLLAEAGILALAWRGGWLRQKLRAQSSLARDLPGVLARRRQVQAFRRIPSYRFARVLTADLDSPYLERIAEMPALGALGRGYWSAVTALLGAIRR